MSSDSIHPTLMFRKRAARSANAARKAQMEAYRAHEKAFRAAQARQRDLLHEMFAEAREGLPEPPTVH